MIEKIQSSAIFASSGASPSGEFQPKTGLTAVVGENGAGKTFLTIETVRWLMFGKAALRGMADDYRDAQATGTLVIRGARYSISRGKDEWVKDASGAMVAKGAEKVTEYITQVLGYGLDVFDLCNAATQGNLQALGDMRPAQRKAIIDKVLRLTEAEQTEKACREEAKGFRRDAETLTKSLRAPGDEPKAPDRDAELLRRSLESQRALRRQLTSLEAQIVAVGAPVKPSIGAFSESEIEKLKIYGDERRSLKRQREELEHASKGAKWSAEQLAAAEVRLRVAEELESRGPKPNMPIGDIKAMQDTWSRISVLRSIDRQETTCPKCGHEFLTGQDIPEDPPVGLAQLGREEEAHRRWIDDVPRMPDGLDLTKAQIENGLAALAAHTKLCALPDLGVDREDELDAMLRDKSALEAYTMARLRYERAEQANDDVRSQIKALGTVPSQDQVDDLADEVHEVEMAAERRAKWLSDEAEFKRVQAEVIEANRLAEEYKAGAKDIADARATVKALIAPKISKIASKLLFDMSMGKLDNLVVDEEMAITVSGQPIATLSGAGKTVANLALRIAMGQALVGHVFPVFLADEIDGDLTEKRREATLEALGSLKKHLTQIILVTHRGVEIADQVVEITL